MRTSLSLLLRRRDQADPIAQATPPIKPAPPSPAAQPAAQPAGSAANSTAGSPATSPGTNRRYWHKYTKLGLTAAVLMVIVSGIVALAFSRVQPTWWRSVDIQDPLTRLIAQRVENGAATELTRVRSLAQSTTGLSEPWTISVRADDATAWLCVRLRPWLESQPDSKFKWPSELQQVQLHFDGGRIYFGASLLKSGQTQVITASLKPEFRADGTFWLPATSVALGRLSMPASWMLAPEHAASADDLSSVKRQMPDEIARLPQTKDMLKALAGRVPLMQSPVIRIGDGRRVRILAMDPRDGVLYITCQTLPRDR